MKYKNIDNEDPNYLKLFKPFNYYTYFKDNFEIIINNFQWNQDTNIKDIPVLLYYNILFPCEDFNTIFFLLKSYLTDFNSKYWIYVNNYFEFYNLSKILNVSISNICFYISYARNSYDKEIKSFLFFNSSLIDNFNQFIIDKNLTQYLNEYEKYYYLDNKQYFQNYSQYLNINNKSKLISFLKDNLFIYDNLKEYCNIFLFLCHHFLNYKYYSPLFSYEEVMEERKNSTLNFDLFLKLFVFTRQLFNPTFETHKKLKERIYYKNSFFLNRFNFYNFKSFEYYSNEFNDNLNYFSVENNDINESIDYIVTENSEDKNDKLVDFINEFISL